MVYLLIGYMWLFIHRPFEVWPWLGALHIERIYAIVIILYWAFFYEKKTWVSNRLNYAFVFFWAAFILANLFSPFDTPNQQRVFEDYLKCIVFFLLVLGSVDDEESLKKLMAGYLVVMSLYMTHSLKEYMNGRHVYRMGVARMIGVDITLGDPNSFAATLVYSLPISFPFWSQCSNWKQRLLLLYYTGLTVLCVLLTGSRSGLVALGVLGVFSLPLLARRKILILLLVAAIPLGWHLMPDDLQNRFRTIVDSSAGPANAQASSDGREQGFWDGVKLWERSPIFGFGPGSHGRAMGHGFEAHNLYGQTLGETGSLGALALLGIITGFFANALEARGMGREYPALRGSFPARVCRIIPFSIVLLLVKGWADHNLYRYTWLWFGAFQGIALHCLVLRRETEEHRAEGDEPQSAENSEWDDEIATGDEWLNAVGVNLQ